MTAGLRMVQEAGGAAFPGFRLRVVERTPSTQDVVRAAARAGAAAGFCCVAMAQSAGRGRQGRVWEAPGGSALLMSVLLRVGAGLAAGVPLVAGVAVCDALGALGVGEGAVGLKWPNDVLVREGMGKLCGVLAEVEPAAQSPGGALRAEVAPAPHRSLPALQQSAGPQPCSVESQAPSSAASPGWTAGSVAVVVGIGLNLAVDAFPPGVNGASLHRLLGRAVTWEEALAQLLPALAKRLAALEDGGIPATAASWRRHALGLGTPITAQTPQGPVTGTALDIADDGALLVATPAGTVRLLAGDVHLGAPPAEQSS